MGYNAQDNGDEELWGFIITCVRGRRNKNDVLLRAVSIDM